MNTKYNNQVVQIGAQRFLLEAWDDQLCPTECVYAGYRRDDLIANCEPSAVVVRSTSGKWSWATADSVTSHDTGGVRVSGLWHTGKGTVLGDARKVWSSSL